MKSISPQLVELQRQLANVEQAYREVDEEWRTADVEYVRLKRHREELDVLKRELEHEINWRVKEIAALQEAIKHDISA
ncbi:hypothetical protein ACTID9_00825 [Brevibacillus fluminis]|uniref:hypothetical protein n=1 Tax=Brevibacillus fluminis TaxID=511487 RepID=UPI003F8AC19E